MSSHSQEEAGPRIDEEGGLFSESDDTVVPESNSTGDGALTEEDVFRMKQLVPDRGSQSIVSLADSSSNFDDRVESVEDAEEISVEDAVQAEKEGGGNQEVNIPSGQPPPRSLLIQGEPLEREGFLFNRVRNPVDTLPETVSRLQLSGAGGTRPELADLARGAEVFLVGTAHFSKKSQEEVRRVIELVQPDAVMVELCPSRISILQLDEETLLNEARNLTLQKVIQQMRQSQAGAVHGLMHVLMASMAAHVTRTLSMAPGGEFRVALSAAKRVPACQFILGDRPIEATLGRAFASLSLWQKAKFLWHIIGSHSMEITAEDVEKCKEADILEQLLKEMAGEFPTLSEVLVSERDKYMACSMRIILYQHIMMKAEARSRMMNDMGTTVPWQPSRLVAVVGIGHAAGIISNWNDAAPDGSLILSRDRATLEELIYVPPPSRSSRVVRLAVKWSFYGFLAFGAFRIGGGLYRRAIRI